MNSIYEDINKRTGGDIYIGVVGPVRTGKSTFIKRFMDTLVIPNIKSDTEKLRATDELPQSSSGRTIMTTEPKFVPENAVKIEVDGGASMKVRLIDCVGYIVEGALGYIEEGNPRMVKTPWYEEPIPFNMAAEVGTRKVINEHSTIGLVITTDGTIGDISREEYLAAEEKVIDELKSINKPYIILLNSTKPKSKETVKLAEQLSEKYGSCVRAVDCQNLENDDIKYILKDILFEFPVKEIAINMPSWYSYVPKENSVKNNILTTVKDSIQNVAKIRDVDKLYDSLLQNENVEKLNKKEIDLGSGKVDLDLQLNKSIFYNIIGELSNRTIESDGDILSNFVSFSKVEDKYLKIKDALEQVEATGYGVVMPSIEELTLQEPEIVKQGGKYGVRLKASAPSIHMMRADITTEVNPIVGSESQSQDLVMYLMKEFEEDPIKIWDSNIFGKSLHELVNEGLHSKLANMPNKARMRLQETLERVINENCSGLICIIL